MSTGERAYAMRVMLIVPSLGAGGAERVAALLAGGLQQAGHAVTAVTIFRREHDVYRLPQRVDRVALDLDRDTTGPVEKIFWTVRRVVALRRTVCERQPEVILSFMHQTNILVLLATVGLGVPVVVSEHVDPRREPLSRRWALLRRLLYGRAAGLVSPSAGVDAAFGWIPASRRRVIPNPVDISAAETFQGVPVQSPRPKTIVAMGRLDRAKGLDVLLEAFAQCADDRPDWGVVILGDGPLRSELQRAVDELKLAGRVVLPGVVDNPFATLGRADLFVLPSRYEAFGNALLEAMACGLPVISTDCWAEDPGIVHDGVDGLIVPPEDVAALSRAMAALMADADRREELARAAQTSTQRFDVAQIVPRWEQTLLRASSAG